MSYAIRNDLQGCRAVNGPGELLDDEFFSDAPLQITVKTRDDIEKQRLIAYADPISGSDRYFSEAARLTAMEAHAADIAAATAAGVARSAEIAAMYPWPDE